MRVKLARNGTLLALSALAAVVGASSATPSGKIVAMPRGATVATPSGTIAAAASGTTVGTPGADLPPVCRTGSHTILSPDLSPGRDGSVYAGAFPSFSTASRNEDAVTPAKMVSFEARAGKRLALATFSNHWEDGRIRYPEAAVRTIWARGTLPVVRMMPWSRQVEGARDPLFSTRGIAAGTWDAELVAWAQAARRSRVPMMVDFAPEMNGDWFPWSGALSGGASGARAYRSAYRHVVRLFRSHGATNVSFTFHVDAEPTSAARWNAAASYYPGDAYVDWVGASVYGSDDVSQPWRPFPAQLERALRVLGPISKRKPVAVWEWGVVEDPANGNKARWIADSFTALRAPRFASVRAVSWWDERWQRDDGRWNDLRISSSSDALAAYRRGIAARRYLGRPALVCARNG